MLFAEHAIDAGEPRSSPGSRPTIGAIRAAGGIPPPVAAGTTQGRGPGHPSAAKSRCAQSPERSDLVTETVEVAVMAEQAAGSMCRDRCDWVDAGDFAMGGGAGAS